MSVCHHISSSTVRGKRLRVICWHFGGTIYTNSTLILNCSVQESSLLEDQIVIISVKGWCEKRSKCSHYLTTHVCFDGVETNSKGNKNNTWGDDEKYPPEKKNPSHSIWLKKSPPRLFHLCLHRLLPQSNLFEGKHFFLYE